jgi:hypothetical protein
MNIYISRDGQHLGLYNEDDALAQKASGSDLQRAVAQSCILRVTDVAQVVSKLERDGER